MRNQVQAVGIGCEKWEKEIDERVRVNRASTQRQDAWGSIPHARGGEPVGGYTFLSCGRDQ